MVALPSNVTTPQSGSLMWWLMAVAIVVAFVTLAIVVVVEVRSRRKKV